ncbi:MAG: hypothetical protein IM504_02755 [Microcystis sp. M038S2]|nr:MULTISPECIES: hypothetical protein [unclassified Microcystis]MCA2703868.1 hypothetical protein [Microcystis sp. M038S2]
MDSFDLKSYRKYPAMGLNVEWLLDLMVILQEQCYQFHLLPKVGNFHNLPKV